MMFNRLRGWLLEKLSGGTYRKAQEATRRLDCYLSDKRAYREALDALDAAYKSEIASLNIRYKWVAIRAMDSFHAAARRGLAEKIGGGILEAGTLTGAIRASTILDEGPSPRGSLNGVVLGPFHL